MTDLFNWGDLADAANAVELTPYPWMEEAQFICVTNMEELRALIDECVKKPYVALDLETEGLDTRIYDGRTVHQIVGFCISHDGKTGYYVPIRHQVTEGFDGVKLSPHNLPIRETEAEIKRLCEGTVTIYHNVCFDGEMLHPLGIELEDPDTFEDTLILDYLRNSSDKQHGLKAISKAHLEMEMFELKEIYPTELTQFCVRTNRSGLDFSLLDPTDQNTRWYTGADAICTFRLFEFLRPYGYKEQTGVYRLEKACTAVQRWMERNRMKVDVPFYRRLLTTLERYERQMVAEIEEGMASVMYWYPSVLHFRAKYDVRKPRDLGNALNEMYERRADTGFDVELERTEESKQVKTSAEVVEELNKRYGDRFPFLKNINIFRSLQKVRGTYVEPLLHNVDVRDNTVRFSFRAHRVDTGRYAGSKGVPGHGFAGINVQSTPAAYNWGKFAARRILSRPEGSGDPTAEQFASFRKQKEKGFLVYVYDGHFFQNLATQEEYCVRKSCEGCPFADACERVDEPKLQEDGSYKANTKLLSLEATVRDGLIAREGRVICACVAEGERVPTSRGILPIEQVHAGDEIQTRLGSRVVKRAWCSGERETLVIQTERGYSLRVTPDHLVLTTAPEGGYQWVQAGDLEEGAWIIQVSDWIKELAPLPLPEQDPISRQATPIQTPSHLTEEVAEFLGRFMGDGCIGHQKGRIKYVGMSLGDDEDELSPVLNGKAERLFGLAFREKGRGDWHCTSQPLGAWLEKVTGKGSGDSETYVVPELVMRAGRSEVGAFLRGLFDADGSVSKRAGDGVTLVNKAYPLIQGVQTLLLGLGIQSRIYKADASKSTYGGDYVYHLRISGERNINRFAKRVGFVTERKRKRLGDLLAAGWNRDITDYLPLELVEPHVKRRVRTANRLLTNGRRRGRVSRLLIRRALQQDPDCVHEAPLHTLVEGPLVFDRVKSKDAVEGTVRVYDLEVEDVHEFMAGGMIVHNCDQSGVELRVAANISGEPKWINEFFRCSTCAHEFERPPVIGRVPHPITKTRLAYDWSNTPKPPGTCPACGSDKIGDLHTLTTQIVYGQDVVNHSDYKIKRQNSKGANFSVLYGGGGSAIARATGVSPEEGQVIKDKMLSELSGLAEWFDAVKRYAKRHKGVQTEFGRMIRLPDIDSDDGRWRSKAERNAVNSIIQGTATGGLTKLSMVRVYRKLKEMGRLDDALLVLTVHDELCFDIRIDSLDDLLPVVEGEMMAYSDMMKWAVPLRCDVELGKSWNVSWNWGLMHSMNPNTQRMAEEVPYFMWPYVKKVPGMWTITDEGEEIVVGEGELERIAQPEILEEETPPESVKEEAVKETPPEQPPEITPTPVETTGGEDRTLPVYRYQTREKGLVDDPQRMTRYLFRLENVLRMFELTRNPLIQRTHLLVIGDEDGRLLYDGTHAQIPYCPLDPGAFAILAEYVGL